MNLGSKTESILRWGTLTTMLFCHTWITLLKISPIYFRNKPFSLPAYNMEGGMKVRGRTFLRTLILANSSIIVTYPSKDLFLGLLRCPVPVMKKEVRRKTDQV